MAEFEIDGVKYQSDKLPLFTQFHVLRRMGSLFSSIVGAGAVRDKDPLLAIGYIATAVSKLSEDDANYVLKNCLSVVKKLQGAVWAPLMSATGNLMFNDLSLPNMLEIAQKVLEDNFGPFIDALLQK